jgi:hypothetical protein
MNNNNNIVLLTNNEATEFVDQMMDKLGVRGDSAHSIQILENLLKVQPDVLQKFIPTIVKSLDEFGGSELIRGFTVEFVLFVGALLGIRAAGVEL